MTHREPTIHHPALMVACPECGSVPGAACYGKTGRRMKGVHKDRNELHQEQKTT